MLRNTEGGKRRPTLLGILVIILVSIVAICGLCGCTGFSYANTINRDGTHRQNALMADFQDNQGDLTRYFTETQNALNIADSNAKAVRDIVQKAVTGGYGSGASSIRANNQLILDIKTAYPNLDATTAMYANAQNIMAGSFDNYLNQRAKLYDELRSFDNWRKDNLVNRVAIAGLSLVGLGFPSNDLVARGGGHQILGVGAQAEEMMWSVISDPQTMKSYQDGILQPLVIPTPSK